MPVGEVQPFEITVSAAGFATAVLEVMSVDHPAEITVLLEPEGLLSGTVLAGDGHPVPEGVTVVAWRSRRDLCTETIESVAQGRPSRDVQLTRTDGSGRFRFAGLDSSEDYRLLAAGGGYWTRDGAGPVRPGPEPVEFRVQTAFATIVEVTSEDGQPVPFDSRLLAQGPTWSTPVQGVEAWSLLGPEIALMRAVYGDDCLQGISRVDAGNWRETLLFYLRDGVALDPVGPVRFELKPPGCDVLLSDVDVPWMGRGGLGRVRLRAKCADCKGDLAFEPQLPIGPGWNSRASLMLKDVNSDHVMQAAFDPANAEFMQFHGVPCGVYEVRVSAYHTIFSWPPPGSPPALVSVVAGQVALVDLSALLGLGRVEFELIDQSGTSYRDSASFEIEYEQAGQSYSRNAVHVSRGPYRCALLPAADWVVRVDVPGGTVRPLEPRTNFTVLPGQTTRVVVPIHRRP